MLQRKIYRYLFLLLAVMQAQLVLGNVRLPAVINSNMVLQQQSTVALWGWSSPAEKIMITTSWNNHIDSVVASGDAKWKINISTPAAGGPYTITLKGHNTITLNNVMVGEVWVCSGQSNMEWSTYNNLQQIIDELPNSHNENLRLFNVTKSTAEYPQDDVQASWSVCSPETLKGFSAVGYFFAKKLQQTLNVPVGIINASWGGTPAEPWTPEAQVNADPELKSAAASKQSRKWYPVTPAFTYNAMISPLTNFNIAGAIWYQGESNVLTASSYSKLFTSMIQGWRSAWHKDFPFYYVQIAPYNYDNQHVGALLREQQAKAASFTNTGMVVITDLVDDVKNIHPNNKLDVGLRLANYALAETYKQNMAAYKSPVFKKMEGNKNELSLFFDNAPNGFVVQKGKTATEFFIAGDDKKFVPAEVKIKKDRIVVFSKEISHPVAVRFAFSNTAMANLFSKEGLPVCPFRTDDWEVDTHKNK